MSDIRTQDLGAATDGEYERNDVPGSSAHVFLQIECRSIPWNHLQITKTGHPIAMF